MYMNPPGNAQSMYAPAPRSVAQYAMRGQAQGQYASAESPRTKFRTHMTKTLTEAEATHMAMLLSEQEERHGINMYDAIRPEDEPELQRLMAIGNTTEQAVLALFESRYGVHHHRRRHSGTLHGHRRSRTSSGDSIPTARAEAVVATTNSSSASNSNHTSPNTSQIIEVTGGVGGNITNNNESSAGRSKPKKLSPKTSFLGSLGSMLHMSSEPQDEARAHLPYHEDDVQILMDMGYKKEQAVAALLQSNNNVQCAIDSLCKSEHSPREYQD